MIENIPQEQLPIIQPTTKSPKFWLPIFAALILVSLVSGGSVYLWQQNVIKQLQNNQNTTAIKPTTNLPTIIEVTAPTPVDPRIELTADGWNKKFLSELGKGDNCSNFFETRFSAKPNTFVTYTSSKFKYSVNLPYNPTWGDKENKVKVYETNDIDPKATPLWFGQPYSNEGCSFFRTILYELPKSTADQAIQQIDAENIKQNKENTSFPETSKYKMISNLKYPILEIDSANAMFGSVKTYKVFLPTVTLEFTNPFLLDENLIVQLVNSIVLLP